MTGATRHSRSIYAAEQLVRATFNDFSPIGDEGCEWVVSLQKEFRILVNLTRRRFKSLKAALENWRQRVRMGEVDFDPGREDDFRGALNAFASLSDLLGEKFDSCFKEKGIYPTKPRLIGLLQEDKKEAQKILDSWRSPEWEVTNERTVRWDKEQTRHLRAKLGSCN